MKNPPAAKRTINVLNRSSKISETIEGLGCFTGSCLNEPIHISLINLRIRKSIGATAEHYSLGCSSIR